MGAAVLALILSAVGIVVSSAESAAPAGAALTGIHKIQHVIVIMQENRSFDNYFGTYPGADGIPAANGHFTVCDPDPAHGGCVVPYYDPKDVDMGACHANSCEALIEDGGKMDGWVAEGEVNPYGIPTDVMGYHDARQVPNYWKYAENFVLNDHMFSSTNSWSEPAHLYTVSGWSAQCTSLDPMSCSTNVGGPILEQTENANVDQAMKTGTSTVQFPWTDLTYLLHKNQVSWAYYVDPGTVPDCVDGAVATCAARPQNYTTPGIWNPLPMFSDVQQDKQVGNVQPLTSFEHAAANGTLPAVSWIVPGGPNSEHPQNPVPGSQPGNSIHEGQAYVTNLINSVMRGPDWNSTAIFVSWDDWGGFYDNVEPPTVDAAGYGFRVPGLVISPYSKPGYVDHQSMSQDAYLKFIEDDFLNGARIDPKTDGRPDSRPDVRDALPSAGDLRTDFNFNQAPRAPLLLPVNPPPGPASTPGG